MIAPTWRFKPADSSQFLPILQLYRDCGQAMSVQGFHNWGDFYPTETQIRFDINNNNLYQLFDENQALISVAVLDELAPDAYQNIHWIYPDLRPFYLHRLAVAPQYWANGIGKIMVERIEHEALQLGGEVLRLDALQINTQLLRFYERQGYQQNEQLVWHGTAWPNPFLCFEKKLSLSLC